MIVMLMLVVATAGCLFGIRYYYSKQVGFLQNTTLNGVDIAGKTAEEVAASLADRYDTSGREVQIMENDEVSIDTTLESLGYRYDRATLEALLTEVYEEQKDDVFILLQTLAVGYEVFSGESYVFDNRAFTSEINSDALAKDRFETEDAKIVFDEDSDTYIVKEGFLGNMIDDSLLQSTIREELDSIVLAGNIPELVTVNIADSVYTSPEPVNNIEELQVEADALTLELRKKQKREFVENASITYTFGTETQVLDSETFSDWFSVDDELNVNFDDEKVKAYVTSLSAKYNTQYHNRTFYSQATGVTVTIPESDNEYGYTILFDSECSKLKENLLSGEDVTREPVYRTSNDYGNPYYLGRQGTDDLAGTYVEVNITRQHLWFYKNGSLIIDSALVSGCVDDEKETKTGAFPLAFKQSPRTLTGDEAGGSGSYSTEVQFWMPFYDGQGLHDATWRSNFGGDIYIENGSHGCVNLPYSVAETIYNNIEEGTAIILYKED